MRTAKTGGSKTQTEEAFTQVSWLESDLYDEYMHSVAIQVPHDHFEDPCEAHEVCLKCGFGKGHLSDKAKSASSASDRAQSDIEQVEVAVQQAEKRRSMLKTQQTLGSVNLNELKVGDYVTQGSDWDRAGEAGVSGASGKIIDKDDEGNLTVQWDDVEVNINEVRIHRWSGGWSWWGVFSAL